MNFLDIFKKNTTVDSTGILSEPGLRLELQILIEKLLKYRKIMEIQSIAHVESGYNYGIINP